MERTIRGELQKSRYAEQNADPGRPPLDVGTVSQHVVSIAVPAGRREVDVNATARPHTVKHLEAQGGAAARRRIDEVEFDCRRPRIEVDADGYACRRPRCGDGWRSQADQALPPPRSALAHNQASDAHPRLPACRRVRPRRAPASRNAPRGPASPHLTSASQRSSVDVPPPQAKICMPSTTLRPRHDSIQKRDFSATFIPLVSPSLAPAARRAGASRGGVCVRENPHCKSEAAP